MGVQLGCMSSPTCMYVALKTHGRGHEDHELAGATLFLHQARQSFLIQPRRGDPVHRESL